MNTINIIDRLILESLINKEKDIFTLADDTQIDKTLLINSIHKLLTLGFINYTRDKKYYFNENLQSSQLEMINSKSCKKVELSQIIEASLEKNKEEKSFNLQKVYMSKEDEKIMNAMLYNINSFIEGLKKKTSKTNAKTSQKRIIFWGQQTYSQVVNQFVESL